MNTMLKILRTLLGNFGSQPGYAGCYALLQGTEFCRLGRYVQDKQVQLLPFGHSLVYGLLVQPPGLYHQPAQAVALHRFAELLFGHGKPRPGGRDLGPARHQQVHKPYR